MSLTKESKFLSLVLRHKPQAVGIRLDGAGWADVQELVSGMSKFLPFNFNMLEEIVRTDAKQQYTFNADKTRIRATEGHSIPVNLELNTANPPEFLWYGTGEQYASSISQQGLVPQDQQPYVQLCAEPDTACMAGMRYGDLVLYRVLSEKMAELGYFFYLSEDGTWLTESVPAPFLEKQ